MQSGIIVNCGAKPAPPGNSIPTTESREMQNVLVFQRDGMGAGKVSEINRLNKEMQLKVIDVDGPFAAIVDYPEEHFPKDVDQLIEWSDLILDHLYHPDLTGYLLDKAQAAGREVVASGRKLERGVTPTTCCTLGRLERLGTYGEAFGAPEFTVALDDEGRIASVEVERGAPCGATWEAAKAVVGMTPEEAIPKIGLATQFNCYAKANPNVFLKNPLHVAGDVHAAALKKAISAAKRG
jgi:hypothetical protein